MSFFRAGGKGAGGTQYQKGNITIAAESLGGTTVNCGFRPKKVFILGTALIGGYYYGDMIIYDEDNGINGFVYGIANGGNNYGEYFSPSDAKVTVSDSGFTVIPQNDAWKNLKAYYYAMES